MSLAPGARLGAYEVVAQFGAGGMGEVYRAHDTKLKRDVALKVLPESFAADPERLARFHREAEVLASLNHPHIAQIHGLEEANGVRALVMELIEGPTLADRIAEGAIPIDEALPIARQIAEALEAAHEQGIIHRDLKPANIKVRADGTVKVLDFGLAKALEPTAAISPKATQSPTITSPELMTGVGVLLGTAAYMSPEQAKGRPAGKRSDIWAFGCVVYEMLAGKRTFPGDELAETMAAVIKSEPDWTVLPPETPPSIHRLLRRCLNKDVKTRLADASSLRFEIDEARNPMVGELRLAPSASHRRVHFAWAIATGVLAVAAAVLGWTLRSAPLLQEMRLTIATPPAMDPASLAISPDGQKIVFEGVSDKRRQLWLRELSSTIARPLPRTEDATQPFWSPDGRAVGFFAAGKLKRIDLDSGTVQPVADANLSGGGSWNRDGVILFMPRRREWFSRVSASGDKPVALPPPATLSPFEVNAGGPRFLPNGSDFMYVSRGNDVSLASLSGSPPRHLLDADVTPVYASGHLFFIRQGTLFGQRFNLQQLSLAGDPKPIAENVGVAVAAESSTVGALLAYRSASSGGNLRQFAWVDRAGNVLEKLGEPFAGGAVGPALSADGKRVVVAQVKSGDPSDLWLMDTTRAVFTRFTFDPFINNAPVWSPDGSRIVFQMNPKGVTDLYQKETLSGAKEERVLSTPEPKLPTDWHGRFLLYQSLSPTTGWDVWALPMEGARQPVAVAQSSFEERNAQFSPDGRWIAYQSDESGQPEIYVQPFPGPGMKTRISTSGGAQVRWRPDGKELFFISLDDHLMVVSIRLDVEGRSIDAGVPAALFTTQVGGAVQPLGRQQYFVSRDGTRFLMYLSMQEAIDAPITVILNWKPQQ